MVFIGVTAMTRLQNQLATIDAKSADGLDDLPVIVMTLDRHGSIVTINYTGAQQLGYTPEALVGKPITSVHAGETKLSIRGFVDACIHGNTQIHQTRSIMLHQQGARLAIFVTGRRALGPTGEKRVTVVGMLLNETAYRFHEDVKLVTRDDLTGLLNRNEMKARIDRAITHAGSNGLIHTFCCLDLHQLKVINTACGRSGGDAMLRQVAMLLTRQVRMTDDVARLGGDEFGILMRGCTLEQANTVVDSLRDEIQNFRFVRDGKKFHIHISAGLVPVIGSTPDSDWVLDTAGATCGVAKDKGFNGVHNFVEHDKDIADRYMEMQWVSRINHALDDNQFQLYIQPIVPLQPGVDGQRHFEVLIRLKDDANNTVYPGEFLSLAERYYLANRIDRWVVKEVVAWLATNRKLSADIGQFCINLSGQSVGDPDFTDLVRSEVERVGIDPKRICFEITETAVIANIETAICFINDLKQLGFFFALDDFGSGLSSFNYLKQLPVDFIKIDGVFVRDIATDAVNRSIVKSIREIGLVTQKQTVGEFVEDARAENELRELGIDYAQGYHTGRPRPLAEFSMELIDK